MLDFLGFLVFCVVVLVPIWFIKSLWNYADTNERALRRYFGEIDEVRGIIPPGHITFVPWFPGIDFVKIPTDVMKLTYKADLNDEIRSKDNVRLYPEVTVYITFPYKELRSLKKMLTAKTPLFVEDVFDSDGQVVEQGLKGKYEDVVMPLLQEECMKVNVDDIPKKKKQISENLEKALRKVGGVFHTNGVTGEVPDDNTEGHGWVSVQIESTGLPEHVSEAMERPVIARHGVETARYDAQASALNAAVTPSAYAMWLETPAGKGASDELNSEVLEAIRQEKLSSDGHYNENAIVVRGPGKTPLDPNLQGLAVFAGLGGGKGGMLFAGKQSNRGQQNPQGGPVPTAQEIFDEHFRLFGKYHPQDPRGKKT